MAALAAIYGAALSTVVYRSQQEEKALRRAEKERRLDVTLSFGWSSSGGKVFPTGLHLNAANPGYEAVTVGACGFRLPSGPPIYVLGAPGTWEFPHTISPGDNADIAFIGERLGHLCDMFATRGFEGTVTVVGFYQDALRHTYTSKPLQFDIQKVRTLVPLADGSPSPPEAKP